MGILRYQLKVHLHHLNRSLNFEVWLSQVPFEGGNKKLLSAIYKEVDRAISYSLLAL